MEGPLTAQDLKFVHWFRKYRDIYRAAERSNLPKNRAKRTFERPEIRDEIERQDLVVEQERARVQVAAEGISKDMLDAELYTLIKLNPKTHSAAKHRAIELGYVRAGVMQGAMKSLDLTPPNPDDETPPPTVYQAFLTGEIKVSAAPILPAVPTPEQALFRERVRELTTPKTPPVPVQQPEPEKPTTPGPVRARRMTVG